MRIRYEIQSKRGIIDLGDMEYDDETITEIVEDHAAHEAEVTWEKIPPKPEPST